MEELKHLKDEINKCVKCGTCRSICPTFRVIGRESASARGKITLIGARFNSELDITDAYLKHIKECTMCGACRDTCPNGVDTIGIINAARAQAVKEQGLPLAANLFLKNILDSSKLMPFALKCAARFQGVFFKDSGVDNGLLSRFSLPLVGQGRLIPPLAETFFLDMPEVKALASDTARTEKNRAARPLKAAFYAGCGVNYLMPNVGVKSIEAVRKAGGDVVVPDSQVCCGMPAYYMGDVETARNLALKNIEAFEGYDCDYIVTACATCTYGLKSVFKELLSGESIRSREMTARVNAFCSKVMDITVLLADVLKYRSEGGNKDAKRIVTYHDPCHLNRNLGVRDEPRELLKGNSSLVFKQMRFPCSCCGLGGGVSLTNYELSIEITKRKAESVRDSGAEVVATACPGCIVQIRDGLHRYGVDAEVKHVVELL
ncbi:MAG: (Fe-S)-binding protein [Deltaproteobacteria bacterium]|nr:(Fe-S)-binding protein [Deltaproteobacteria bacterium]